MPRVGPFAQIDCDSARCTKGNTRHSSINRMVLSDPLNHSRRNRTKCRRNNYDELLFHFNVYFRLIRVITKISLDLFDILNKPGHLSSRVVRSSPLHVAPVDRCPRVVAHLGVELVALNFVYFQNFTVRSGTPTYTKYKKYVTCN